MEGENFFLFRAAVVAVVALLVYVTLSIRAAFRRAASRVLVYGSRSSPGFLKLKFALSAMGVPFMLVPEESPSRVLSLHTHSRGLSMRNGRGISVPRDYDAGLDGKGPDALPEMPYCILDGLGMHDTSRILPWIGSQRPGLCLRGPIVGTSGTKVDFLIVSHESLSCIVHHTTNPPPPPLSLMCRYCSFCPPLHRTRSPCRAC